jgi:hypothetical protein
MRLLLLSLGVLMSNISFGQSELFDDLSYYGDIMVNAFDAKHRVRAKQQFEVLIDDYITQGKYAEDDWAAVEEYTRMVVNDDESTVILTYQVDEGVHPWYYGGYIIVDDKATKLNQNATLDGDSAYQSYSAEDWYGALYYNMLPIKGNKDSYLLFGYQFSKEFEKTKLIEVLTIDDQGISFGKDLFITRVEDGRDDIKQRFLLEYSSDTNVSLNYNESIDMIIFDHTMPRMGQQAGQGNTFVPDGTYEGYQFDKGSFVYVEKIFDHIYESAPRPEPVLNSSKGGRDIIGRSKN